MILNKNHQPFEAGQSLFEIVVAVGIVGLIIAAIVGLATTSIRNTTFSRDNSLATRYSQEAVEWLRSQRDTDWVAFHAAAQTSAIYCLDFLSFAKARACNAGEVVTDTVLMREVTFPQVLPASISATVTTFWTDAQGAHQVETSTVFTDWRSR